jgi:hypothetical protein
VSAQVKSIVEFINATPKCTRRQLIEALAPTPKSTEPAAPATTPAEGAPPAAPAETVTTPEQASVIGDLHWLIHQGHVIEFANGILETAKKPAIKPPKAPKEPKAEAPTAETPAGEFTTTESAAVEAAPATENAAPAAEPVAAVTEPPPPATSTEATTT